MAWLSQLRLTSFRHLPQIILIRLKFARIALASLRPTVCDFLKVLQMFLPLVERFGNYQLLKLKCLPLTSLLIQTKTLRPQMALALCLIAAPETMTAAWTINAWRMDPSDLQQLRSFHLNSNWPNRKDSRTQWPISITHNSTTFAGSPFLRQQVGRLMAITTLAWNNLKKIMLV